MKTTEVLFNRELSTTARQSLNAMAEAAKSFSSVRISPEAKGCGDVLLLWGSGGYKQSIARELYLSSGRRCVMLDMGYAQDKPGKDRRFRISIDDHHPQRWLSKTDPDKTFQYRWDVVVMRERELGTRVVLVDMGPKAKKQYSLGDWAEGKLRELVSRGISRTEIIHRPKPKNPYTPIPGIATDNVSTMQTLLVRARLIVAHHSNACVEAAIAGVPFECEDGAAKWLQEKEFTYENRYDFIARLSRWQYRPQEAAVAWQFIRGILKCA